MTEPKRPLKVFLSYASQDRPLVRELSRQLVDEGWIDTWVDEKSLLPGQDWRVKIEEAVEEADVVLICLSNHSVSKEGYVQKELRYAREIALEKPEETIFLIPLRLDECEVPRGLRFYQWVDYFGDEKNNSYDALVKSLKLRYEQKLKLEELEHIREEKARLEAEEIARQKTEKEKAEREAAERAAREKAEKEAVEKARLDAEELKKQRVVRRSALPKKARPDTAVIVAVMGFIGVIFSALISSPMLASLFSRTPEPTATLVSTATQTRTPAPTHTPPPSKTPTEFVTPTATPYPTEITDAKGVQMVLVPTGSFTMGSSDPNTYVLDRDQNPAHNVFLDSFYIDKYEVTNKLYKACVDAGVCDKPHNRSSSTYSIYYGNPELDDYPVIYVDWYQAKAYCEWRGARLPTEAEWEKAAQGVSGSVNEAKASDQPGDPVKVGSYPSGNKSNYGVYDMRGNVWEWVNDWYQSNYYSILGNSAVNPQGPSGGDYKVLRGGSWSSGGVGKEWDTSVINRYKAYPTFFSNDTGFRCASFVP